MGLTKQVKRRPRPVPTPPIVLVGFMGCGKSTLGQAFAKSRPGTVFVDLDACISKQARESIPEIFSRHGEVHFRKLETAALCANLRSGRILAAGGGLLTIAANVKALRRQGARIVWVDVGWAELWRRLQKAAAAERPLLVDSKSGKPKSQASVRLMWRARRRIYKQVADLRLAVRAGELPKRTQVRLQRLCK